MWRQYQRCGSIYPRYELKQEGTLGDFTEASYSQFQLGNGHVSGVGESWKFDRTLKRQHKKKLKRDLFNIKDPELRRDIAKGAMLISYEEK